MPNADAKNNPKELLMQIESELRQIHHQIDSINATIKPWQDELASLKDYRKQLLDLHEATQRRTVKPRIVTVERKCVTKVTVTDPATQQLIDILKGFSSEDLNKLCMQISTQNGDFEETTTTLETED